MTGKLKIRIVICLKLTISSSDQMDWPTLLFVVFSSVLNGELSFIFFSIVLTLGLVEPLQRYINYKSTVFSYF